MNFMRSRRRLAGLAVAAIAVGVMSFVVLPAVASNPNDLVGPASGKGVLPVDEAIGGNGTCSNLFPNLANVSEYDNSNPRTTRTAAPSGHQDGASFDLSLTTDKTSKNQFLDFTAHGAAVLAVGVNGGNDTAAYDYTAATPAVAGVTNGYTPNATGAVTSDTGLHAPAQSWSSTTTTTGGTTVEVPPSQLYSVSHLTICYLPVLSVSGTVFDDLNQDGVKGTSTTDPGLSGWTINLSKDGTQVVATATSSSNGAYSLSAPFAAGSTYSICETPPSGTWAQTLPAPSSGSVCTAAGQLPKGYQVTASATAQDFGNVGGIMCTPGQEPFGPSDYQLGTCKSTSEVYVFNSGTIASGTYQGAPFVSYWVTDTSQQVSTIEHLTFPDPIKTDSNGTRVPTWTKLFYSDNSTFPLDPANPAAPKQMPYCNLDPRSDGRFAIDPNATGVLPTGNTSCAISITTAVGTDGAGTLEAWVYATGDSSRWPQ